MQYLKKCYKEYIEICMCFEKIENDLRKVWGNFFVRAVDNKAGYHLDLKTYLNTSHKVTICSNIIILSQEKTHNAQSQFELILEASIISLPNRYLLVQNQLRKL